MAAPNSTLDAIKQSQASTGRTVSSLDSNKTKEWAKAVARKYGMNETDAYRAINYLPQDFYLGDFNNIDDDVAWREKEIGQAIAKLGQDDGVDYLGGESLQSQTEAKAQQAKEEQNKAKLGDVYDRISKFAEQMNMPVDQLLQSDGYARATRNNAFNQSQDRARGLSGGLSQANTQRATTDALTQYQMQRQQMGQQALGQLGGMAQQAVARDDDWKKFNMDLDLQMQQAQADAQQQAFAERQGVGQAIGSAAGGLIGGVGGFFAGGPAGAAAGAKAGASIGGGLGGGAATGFKPYQPYRYKAPKAYGGSGGLSGGGNL